MAYPSFVKWCAGTLFVGAVGCASPQQDYDDFVDRFEDIPREAGTVVGFDAGGDAGDCIRTEGTIRPFFLTIAPVFNSDVPSLLRADIEIVDGGNAMVLSVQSYAAADRKTLVGEVSVTDPVMVADDGTFTSDSTVLDVHPDANAVLVGQPAKTEVSLTGGRVCDDADFACGTVMGRVIEPVELSLDNSTWTAQLIEDEANPPAPLKNCNKDPVPPL